MLLKEYYKMCVERNEHCLFNESSPIWAGDYWTSPEAYDYKYFNQMFGTLKVDADFNMIRNLIKISITSNEPKFNKIFNAMNMEWNPLWNVDGTETTTYSEVETVDTIGATSETNQYGARSSSTQYGNTSTTSSNTSTDGFEGIGSSDFANRDRNITSGTMTEAAHSDTSTAAAATDTTSMSEHINNNKVKEHTVTIERQGNIGVTKSSDLLASAFEVYNVNFMDFLMKTIITDICDLFYED